MEKNFFGIGERLKILLHEKKLKQIEACNKASISKNAMSNYINGNRIPDTFSLYKLAKLFDVQIEWILTGLVKPQVISDGNDLPRQYVAQITSENYVSTYLLKDEQYFISKFRKLSDDDRDDILALLNIKYNRLILKEENSSHKKLQKIDNIASNI